MAGLPQPPVANDRQTLYLLELVAALETRLARLEATQRERFAVTNPGAPSYALDGAAADLAELRAVTATLITALTKKGVI